MPPPTCNASLAHAARIRAQLALARIPQIDLLQQRVDHLAALGALRQSLEHRKVIEQILRDDLRMDAEVLRQTAELAQVLPRLRMARIGEIPGRPTTRALRRSSWLSGHHERADRHP